MKLFDVEYKINDDILKHSISEVVFFEFKENLISKGGEIISVTERPLPEREKKAINQNTIEKTKYYYSKYITEKRRLDNKRITIKDFEERIKLLKILREQCTNKADFKEMYEKEYKR